MPPALRSSETPSAESPEPDAGRWPTLVEHFIRIDGWPTGRKTALISGVALALHLPGTLMVDWAIQRAGPLAQKIDAELLQRFLWAWTAEVALTFVICMFVVRSGREGRWTALLLAPYGMFLAAMMWLFGFISSALTAAYPLVILTLAVLYGPRFSAYAFAFGLVVAIALLLLQTGRHIPFAPLFVDRSLDTQNLPIFVVPVFVIFMGFFAALFGVMMLLLIGRQHERALLRTAHRQLHHSAELIRRYVPSQVVERVLAGEAETAQSFERRKLTVFFSDLVGFTAIAEELEPEDLSRVLNEYFTEMVRIAHRHGGTVDELSGDAILVLFGAPVATNDRDHALRAARMATEMQLAMRTLNASWSTLGLAELRVRMGIDTGVVTVGNFGSPERIKYTALGKHVNLAARLQTHCEPGKTLLSHATWLLIRGEFPCIPREQVQLKGILKPVRTYELTGPVASPSPG